MVQALGDHIKSPNLLTKLQLEYQQNQHLSDCNFNCQIAKIIQLLTSMR